MIVLALDPGKTTGWAGAWLNEGDICIKAGQADYSPAQLWALLSSIRPDHLVCESFEYRNKARPGLELFSRNLMGVCELWQDVSHCHYRTQSPSEAMAFFSDPRLKKGGHYTVGQDHARDATRHLLYYLTFKKGSQLWNSSFSVLPPLSQ